MSMKSPFKLGTAMPKYPQVMVNVRVVRRIDPRTLPEVASALAAAEAALQGTGRVVLRASGTEPLIRVMVEGQDAAQVRETAERLAAVVKAAAA